jgi:tetratricopeptide (TPR) repeat protein
MDLSYNALPPQTRTVFRLLGLVPGADFTVESTAALNGIAVQEARRELGRLVSAHLVDEHVPGRYRFHDLLRLYATERAETQDDPDRLEEARRRLYDYYLHSARAAVELVHPIWSRLPLPACGAGVTAAAFGDRASAVVWLAAEHPNLVDAIRMARIFGPRSLAWLLADAMRGQFRTTWRTTDWLSCAEAAVAAAGEEGDAAAMASALLVLADAHSHQDAELAISLYSRGIALADQAGWTMGLASMYCNLANLHCRLGQLDEAANCIEQARLVFPLGWITNLSTACRNLASVQLQLGNLEAAYDNLTQAVQHSAYHFGEPEAKLSEVCWLLGRFEEALHHADLARSEYEATRTHAVEPDGLRILAEIHSDLGSFERAMDFGGRALERSREIRDSYVESLTLNTLGRIHLRTGQPAQAMERHRQAMELSGPHDSYPKAEALIGLSNAAGDLGRHEAASFAEKALQIARERAFRLLEGQALTALADITLMAGRPPEATRHAERALEIHRETGHRLGEARTLHMLGNAAHALHDATAGAHYRNRAAGLFQQIGVPEATVDRRKRPA